jgi:Tol biopolymer transport system component
MRRVICQFIKIPLFALFCLSASLNLPLGAAKASSAPPAAVASSALKSHDIIFYSIAVKQRLILVRMEGDGSAALYLSQSRQSFVPFIPTDNKGDDWSPVISPDGKWVAFYSTRTGTANLYLMEIGGAGQKALTSSETDIVHQNLVTRGQISFSPDSTRLTYLSFGDIWIYRLDTEQAEAMTREHGVKAMAWSPDNKYLAFTRDTSLLVLPIHSNQPQLFVANTVTWPSLQFEPKEGKQVLYFQKGAWTVNLKDKTRKRLFTSLVTPNYLQYSPAGGSFCMLVESPDHAPEVFTLTLDGKTTQITRGGADFCFYSSDGKKLYFIRQGQLWTIGADSKGARLMGESHALLPFLGTALFPDKGAK